MRRECMCAGWVCVCVSIRSGVDGLGLSVCEMREQDQGNRVYSRWDGVKESTDRKDIHVFPSHGFLSHHRTLLPPHTLSEDINMTRYLQQFLINVSYRTHPWPLTRRHLNIYTKKMSSSFWLHRLLDQKTEKTQAYRETCTNLFNQWGRWLRSHSLHSSWWSNSH